MMQGIGELDHVDEDQGDEPAAWMQRDDGSWCAVDEYGVVHALEGPDLDELDDGTRMVLYPVVTVDVAPTSVVDTEVER